MKTTFTTSILLDDKVNATGISVPPESIAELGKGKKPPVKVTLNGFTYQSTVAAFGDVYMLPLSKERREAAGVKPGDTLEVTLELDLEPRTVEVPEDLAAALAAQPGARAAFDAQNYSTRKEHARQVETAKAQETRERRIAKIVTSLSGK
jgi:hypothetical protein